MKTEIFTVASMGDRAIENAAEILRRGGIVAIPTETVYGLAGNALDGETAKKIYRAKGRPCDNPLIVHISEISQWESLVEEIPERALRLAEAFWPGPLTIILRKSEAIPDEVSGGLSTVAVRMPSDETARKIISACGLPLAAPSANTSGKPSPTCAKYVIEDLYGKVDAIVDAGDCSVGVESTVVSLCSDIPLLLRPGGITPEMLKGVLGEIEIDAAVFSQLEKGQRAASPGMKYKHYSPEAQVVLVKGSLESYKSLVEKNAEGTVALCFEGEEELLNVKCVTYGRKEDAESQAKNIFDALRRVDELGAERVYARFPESEGVGLAVFNRLIRAAGFNIIEV